MKVRFWEKNALTTVQIALSFASCNFPVTMPFFPKSHSRPCDYRYKLTLVSKPEWSKKKYMPVGTFF